MELCIFWTRQIILSWTVWIYAYFSTHFNYLGTERGEIVWFYEKFKFKFFKNDQTIFWQSIHTIFYLFTISDTWYFPLRKENITRLCIWQRPPCFLFYVFGCFPVCMCVHHLCAWCCRGHRGALTLQEVELLIVVNCPLGAGTWALCSAEKEVHFRPCRVSILIIPLYDNALCQIFKNLL